MDIGATCPVDVLRFGDPRENRSVLAVEDECLLVNDSLLSQTRQPPLSAVHRAQQVPADTGRVARSRDEDFLGGVRPEGKRVSSGALTV